MLGHVLDQSLEQEVPLLPTELLERIRGNFQLETGDDVDKQSNPSDAQLTALYFRAFHEQVRYVDFAIWGPLR